MRAIVGVSRLARHLALAGALALFGIADADAAPVTGSGQPISNEQPSLGLDYLISDGAAAATGEVALFASASPSSTPGGWLPANGQIVPIAEFPALFAQIGATYGGNGVTTFALPNLNGAVAIGAGQGVGLTNRPLGSAAGSATQTLTANELPPFGGAIGMGFGGQPISIVQPSVALNYGLLATGIFPSRGGGGPASTALIGQIFSYAGPTLPSGQFAADGQILPIAPNTALFSILGFGYGGNGVNNFALPDLRGRAPIGAGAAAGLTPHTLGEQSGAEATTLSVAQLPPQRLMLPNGASQVIGVGLPFSVDQPSLGLNYIIAVSGQFPSAGIGTPGIAYLGEIALFAGNFAPSGWMFASGETLSIAADTALFALLGTTYGGDGRSTFDLPDLNDRLAVGIGDGVTLGETFGSDNDTLTFAQLPVGYPAAVTVLSSVPEPSGAAVFGVALGALLLARRHLPRRR